MPLAERFLWLDWELLVGRSRWGRATLWLWLCFVWLGTPGPGCGMQVVQAVGPCKAIAPRVM